MTDNLLHCLYENYAPDAEVFRFVGEAEWTISDLRMAVGRMAHVLQSYGVAHGDRVSFRLEKSAHTLVLAQACLQLGAVLHPLNTSYTQVEIASLLADATPKLFVIDDPENVDQLPPDHKVQTVTIHALVEHAQTLSPLTEICRVSGDDAAALLYTSGTTGRPKGALITHRNLSSSARNLVKVWEISGQDTLIHVLPLYHAHGLLTAVNSMMCTGAKILFTHNFDVDLILENLPRATVFMGVPTLYYRLLQHDKFAVSATGLRLAISGSAPLSQDIANRFFEATGNQIVERYGATETAIVTATPPGKNVPAGWVGWALPETEIRVVTGDGTFANLDAIGDLETRGPNVFSGYLNAPAGGADAFSADGWFKTGDIAEIDATGCVRLLGRTKDLIISGGLNVYAKEVEDVLDAHLNGGQSAVFGVPHPDFGEAVVAAVEGADNAGEILNGSLKSQLAPYKIPKKIIHIDKIPRNQMGKVQKVELRARYSDIFINPTNQPKR